MSYELWEVGQTLTVDIQVYDATDTLVTLGTAPTCTVTRPDQTTTSATVTLVSTGRYRATLVSTQAGRHLFTWNSVSQTNSGGFPKTDVVNVAPADPRYLISLEEARAELNFTAGNTDDDEELRAYLGTITEVIEGMCGPIVPKTVTTTFRGVVGSKIALTTYPVLSVTTVTEYPGATTVTAAATPAASGYEYDADAGVLYRNYANWQPTVVVVTRCGRSTVPEAARDAARLCLRHMWGSRQQSVGRSRTDAIASTVAAWRIPNAARETLEAAGLIQSGGFA